MSRFISLSILTFGCFAFGNYTLADIGGDHLIANTPGRCWRVMHRDFAIKGNLVSGYAFKMLTVGGSGETDDILTYELTIKEDFTVDDGWDESKTRQFNGSGLIKSMDDGKIRFEIYVDLGNGETPLTIQGHYHPGNGTSDFDDRVILEIPGTIQSNQSSNNDCDEEDEPTIETMDEGTDNF